jgi:hypothetical protein
MKHLGDRAAPMGVYVLMTRITSRLVGVTGIGLGVALIAGGPDRFGARGFAVAREVPGQQYTWGAIALASGLCVLAAGMAHKWRVLTVGTAALGAWSMFFTITLTAAAVRDHRAAVTGTVIYGMFTALTLIQYAGLQQGRRDTS